MSHLTKHISHTLIKYHHYETEKAMVADGHGGIGSSNFSACGMSTSSEQSNNHEAFKRELKAFAVNNMKDMPEA